MSISGRRQHPIRSGLLVLCALLYHCSSWCKMASGSYLVTAKRQSRCESKVSPIPRLCHAWALVRGPHSPAGEDVHHLFFATDRAANVLLLVDVPIGCTPLVPLLPLLLAGFRVRTGTTLL